MNSPFNGPSFGPVKRLGLSRKRKSCGTLHELCNSPEMSKERHYDNSKKDDNDDECREAKIKKSNMTVCDTEKEVKNYQVVECDQSVQQDKMDKMEELKGLYSIWKTGCKNAVLYLISILKERQDGSVDMKKLLKELRIWEVLLFHFKDDSELEFLETESDSDDHTEVG